MLIEDSSPPAMMENVLANAMLDGWGSSSSPIFQYVFMAYHSIGLSFDYEQQFHDAMGYENPTSSDSSNNA